MNVQPRTGWVQNFARSTPSCEHVFKVFAPIELRSKISLPRFYGCEHVLKPIFLVISFLFQSHTSLYLIFGLRISPQMCKASFINRMDDQEQVCDCNYSIKLGIFFFYFFLFFSILARN